MQQQVNWIQTGVSVLLALISSTGLWAFIASRRERKDARTQLMVGIAHDLIISRGTQYIDRGFITPDEYENLHDYLYQPYEKLGGNGSAKRIMEAVNNLPFHN